MFYDYIGEETLLVYFFDGVHFESVENTALQEHIIQYGGDLISQLIKQSISGERSKNKFRSDLADEACQDERFYVGLNRKKVLIQSEEDLVAKMDRS